MQVIWFKGRNKACPDKFILIDMTYDFLCRRNTSIKDLIRCRV